jgi:carbon monoxide dehydrogenase subunit G
MTTRKTDWSKRTSTKKTPGTTVELADRVEVPSTPEQVWARLADVPLVASCLPGLDPATLVAESDAVYRARMANTVMGISANWDLRATIEPDAPNRHLTVRLDGTDSRLNMKMNGVAEVRVGPGEDVSIAVLDYTANLRIDGTFAAMGGPVVRSIMADALAQFISVMGGVERTKVGLWGRLRGLVRSLRDTLFRRRTRSSTQEDRP